MPKVLNYHIDFIPTDAVWIIRGYKYGNPYIIGEDGTRDEVCDKYEEYVLEEFTLDEIIKDLRGKDLVCCCKPKRCHGDFLLKMANKEI